MALDATRWRPPQTLVERKGLVLPMSDTFSKAEVVRILANLDALVAGEIPEAKRAWAHIFIACGLIQKVSPVKLTREHFMWSTGQVYDHIQTILAANGEMN